MDNGRIIRGFTLHQPWATLIAKGHKTVETRSWAPSRKMIGQSVAIHAGKKKESFLNAPECWQPLMDGGVMESVPLGAIVCTALLEDVVQVQRPMPHVLTGEDGVECQSIQFSKRAKGEKTWVLVDDYGDFGHGRFLWLLKDIVPNDPIYCRGFQGLWEIPEDVMDKLVKDWAGDTN